jgi:hypothetical protein
MADYGNGSRFERKPGFAQGLAALLSGVTAGQQQNFENQMKQQEVEGRQKYYDAYAQNAQPKDPMAWVKNFPGMRVKQVGPQGPVFEPDTPPEMTAGQRLAKDKATQSIFDMVESNKVRKESILKAKDSLKRIPTGLPGKLQTEWMKRFDTDNPLLTDWQNVKSVLTEAQLDYVAKTKGAVSDKEMILFGQAVGNDDLPSVARMSGQMDKLIKHMDAQEQAKFKAYTKIYGEDPKPWFSEGESFDPMTGQAVGAPQAQIQGLPGQSTPADALEAEAQQAIANGADPKAVAARIAQLRGQ